MDQSQPERSTDNDGISIKDLIGKIRSLIKYIKGKWPQILIVSVVCALLGFGYSLIRKKKYTAVCTFVLEESGKGGALGQYAGLASLAGIDIGGGGGGIFQGENILELYKSRSMIKKTLLSEVDINGKKQSLIERYIEFNHLRDSWKEKEIPNVTFNGDPDKFSRTQDSIITTLVKEFNKSLLSITKPDKKVGIIYVQVTSTDELFAKEFTNKLVDNVNSFYIRTKIKKTQQNVLILQHQSDSVRAILNSSINGVASAIDATPNANPALVTLRVPSQKKQIDVQANSSIYAEMVKNLEISKISLRQETPLIQIIDKPVLPLTVDALGKIKAIVIGALLGLIISVIGLTTKKIYKDFIG